MSSLSCDVAVAHATSRSSAFLELPPELRVLVYTELFTHTTAALPVHDTDLPGLLLTCKQVQHEALPVFYECAHFYARSFDFVVAQLRTLEPASRNKFRSVVWESSWRYEEEIACMVLLAELGMGLNPRIEPRHYKTEEWAKGYHSFRLLALVVRGMVQHWDIDYAEVESLNFEELAMIIKPALQLVHELHQLKLGNGSCACPPQPESDPSNHFETSVFFLRPPLTDRAAYSLRPCFQEPAHSLGIIRELQRERGDMILGQIDRAMTRLAKVVTDLRLQSGKRVLPASLYNNPELQSLFQQTCGVQWRDMLFELDTREFDNPALVIHALILGHLLKTPVPHPARRKLRGCKVEAQAAPCMEWHKFVGSLSGSSRNLAEQALNYSPEWLYPFDNTAIRIVRKLLKDLGPYVDQSSELEPTVWRKAIESPLICVTRQILAWRTLATNPRVEFSWPLYRDRTGRYKQRSGVLTRSMDYTIFAMKPGLSIGKPGDLYDLQRSAETLRLSALQEFQSKRSWQEFANASYSAGNVPAFDWQIMGRMEWKR